MFFFYLVMKNYIHAITFVIYWRKNWPGEHCGVHNTVQAIFKAAKFPEATGASLMDKEEIFV